MRGAVVSVTSTPCVWLAKMVWPPPFTTNAIRNPGAAVPARTVAAIHLAQRIADDGSGLDVRGREEEQDFTRRACSLLCIPGHRECTERRGSVVDRLCQGSRERGFGPIVERDRLPRATAQNARSTVVKLQGLSGLNRLAVVGRNDSPRLQFDGSNARGERRIPLQLQRRKEGRRSSRPDGRYGVGVDYVNGLKRVEKVAFLAELQSSIWIQRDCDHHDRVIAGAGSACAGPAIFTLYSLAISSLLVLSERHAPARSDVDARDRPV